MNSVKLNISLNGVPVQLILTSPESSPHPEVDTKTASAQLHFSMTDTLSDEGEGTIVFRGSLSAIGINMDPIDVIAKLVQADEEKLPELASEANMYTTLLKDLQGKVVPNFYGYFTLPATDSQPEMACIILEYCGSSPEGYISDWNEDARMQIKDHMIAIHDAGVMHGDFNPSHAVVSDVDPTDWRIIDFSWARKHSCKRQMDVMLYQWQPTRLGFGCAHLFKVIHMLDLWTPTGLYFPGSHTFSIFSAPTVKRLYRYARRWTPWRRREVLLEDAREVLGKYYARYDHRWEYIGHPMDLKTPFLNKKNEPVDSDGESDTEVKFRFDD